jgi:putative phage-type endonuclease
MSLQRTDEWHQARIGKATGSRIADLTARIQKGYGVSRENYMWELVKERRTGKPHTSYVSWLMQQGIDREPEARAQYALTVIEPVTEAGFYQHPTIAMSGASPDGLVGDHGLVEIKCPDIKAHYAVHLSSVIEIGYQKQVQWQLACTGRDWCDWVSYYPDLPIDEQLFVKRVIRNDEMIAELEREVIAFLHEVDEAMRLLDLRFETLRNAA